MLTITIKSTKNPEHDAVRYGWVLDSLMRGDVAAAVANASSLCEDCDNDMAETGCVGTDLAWLCPECTEESRRYTFVDDAAVERRQLRGGIY